MTAPLIGAALAFLACLGGACWLGRARRERAAFAALLGAPLVVALAFAVLAALPQGGTAAAPPVTADVTPAGEAPTAAAGESSAVPSAAPGARPANGEQPAVDSWRHEAEQLRRARRYADARAAYTRIVHAVPGDADAWADLADVSAAAADGDLGAGREAIERALEVDPGHLKALWLKASLELQARRYASAAALWQRLLARLPADSNDAHIVSANLEETRTLALRQGAAR